MLLSLTHAHTHTHTRKDTHVHTLTYKRAGAGGCALLCAEHSGHGGPHALTLHAHLYKDTHVHTHTNVQVRAAVLYFVLNDLGTVDPMYQFSLDAYNDVFASSLKMSPKPENLSNKTDALPLRIKSLNDYHTYVFRFS